MLLYPALHLKCDGGDLQSLWQKTFPDVSALSAKIVTAEDIPAGYYR